MKIENSMFESAQVRTGTSKVKNIILQELEVLTNNGQFEDLVNLYITTFIEVKPDPERLRKIKKKVVKKLVTRQESFTKADLSKIKMRVLNDELELQINMIQNELTRTIILLVTYMVKHGNDDTTKEVFRWIKEQRKNTHPDLATTMDKGRKVEQD
jgi:Zn-dependent M16 (insulinase) family peptidase